MRNSIMLGIPLGLALLTAASPFAQLTEKKVITLAPARKPGLQRSSVDPP
jgi:hypothetical protein